MKNFHLPPLLSLCAIALVISTCTLEKEPEIPTGFNIIKNPANLTGEVTPDGNKFMVNASLDSLGNLTILHHGWVWSETSSPTVEDDSLDLGKLETLSFSTEITGLDMGKLYYLRPFVINGCGVFYGNEDICSFLGVNFEIATGPSILQGMQAQFTNQTPGDCTYLWDFGDGKTSTEMSPKHIYNKEPGTVTVRLTADIDGCKVTQAMTLNIIANPFENYMVPIQGGTFTMGCTDEQENQDPVGCDMDEWIVHSVTIQPFFMGRTEITQGQWLAVMGENPSFFNLCGANCPVENVSWNDVQVFIAKLNAILPPGETPFRLPTESEWEYAARGNEALAYAGSSNLDLVAWNSDNANGSTHTVMTKDPNGFLLYDMSGNVYEYVEDYYHGTYDGAPQDGSAWLVPPDDRRVNRSGGWTNDRNNCRTANRVKSLPGEKNNYTGFRLARY